MTQQPLGRARSILVWALTLLASLGIGLAGLTKFLQAEHWHGLFASWGYPPSFSFFVGAAEVAGALALLVPRVSSFAATLLAMVMLSAAVTLLRHPGGPLGWGMTPLFYLVVLAVVGTYRWPRVVPAQQGVGGG